MNKQGMFHTPDSWEDLLRWIQLHPKTDQVHILTAAMMSWNLACDTIKKEKSHD